MVVWLVRHAIAHERDRSRWPNDALRPLTVDGKKKFRKAARGLVPYLPKSVALLTSPFIRARETATILARALSRTRIVECDALASGKPVNETFDLLRSRKEKSVVLVGHEPDLGKLMTAALAGNDARLRVEFKKGGAVCLEFARRIEPGEGTLLCMLPPRVLRALG
jgi:phosphohistidine phosphatase